MVRRATTRKARQGRPLAWKRARKDAAEASQQPEREIAYDLTENRLCESLPRPSRCVLMLASTGALRFVKFSVPEKPWSWTRSPRRDAGKM